MAWVFAGQSHWKAFLLHSLLLIRCQACRIHANGFPSCVGDIWPRRAVVCGSTIGPARTAVGWSQDVIYAVHFWKIPISMICSLQSECSTRLSLYYVVVVVVLRFWINFLYVFSHSDYVSISLSLSLSLWIKTVNLYAHHLAKNVLIRIDKHGKISELSDQDKRMSRTTATVGFFGPALGRLLLGRQTSNSFRSHRKNGGSALARKQARCGLSVMHVYACVWMWFSRDMIYVFYFFYIDVVDVYISSTLKLMNSSCLPAVKIQIFTDAYVALEAFACPPQPWKYTSFTVVFWGGGQPASPWVEGNGELHDLGDVRVCLEFSNQGYPWVHEVYCLISDIISSILVGTKLSDYTLWILSNSLVNVGNSKPASKNPGGKSRPVFFPPVLYCMGVHRSKIKI